MIALADAVPAIVTLTAQTMARSEKGVVGLRVHRVFQVHAGPYSRNDDMELAEVLNDGRVVKVRVLYQRVGGRETDAATKAQTEQRYEHPAPLDVFKRPFDSRYVNEYTFSVQQGSIVTFRALVRDAAHGDGTFSADSGGDVWSMRYSPCVMPPYARSGEVQDTYAQVLPAYWAVTREVQQYSGRYMIFAGGATATIESSRFVRFPTEAAALGALAKGGI